MTMDANVADGKWSAQRGKRRAGDMQLDALHFLHRATVQHGHSRCATSTLSLSASSDRCFENVEMMLPASKCKRCHDLQNVPFGTRPMRAVNQIPSK